MIFGDSKKETKISVVRQKLNEALYKQEHNINTKDCKLTLNEWVDIWLKEYYQRTVTVGSYLQVKACYDRSVRNSELGNLPLTLIRNVHIQHFVNDLAEERNLSHSSILPYLRAIKLSLEKACECEYIFNNPAARISLPKDDIKPKDALSLKEQELFFAYADNSYYCNFFRFLLLTGVRVGEAIALTWDDIDLKKCQITINKTAVMTKRHQRNLYEQRGYQVSYCNAAVITPPKTKNSNRIIPMSASCYELLKRIKLKKKKDVSIVFPSQADTYLTVSGIDCAIKNICNEINSQSKEKIQRFSAHTFRHTYATRCLENGINPKTVQYFLGHSSLQTTMNIYTHVTMEQAKKEVLSVDIIKL